MAVAAQAQSRERLNVKSFFSLLKETFKEWSEDKVPRLGASLAYYTAFSIAPMLVIAIAIAGLFFDPNEVERAAVGQLQGLMGESGAEFIQGLITNARNNTGAGIVATVISIVTLVLGALGAFSQLQDAMNTIWEVKPKEGRGILGVLKDRLLSMGMVLVIAFMLMVSLVVSTVLAAVGDWIGAVLPLGDVVLGIINFLVSFAVITVLFALMFKYLPDAKIAWSDVWIGAAFTALLFTIGKTLIGIYLGNASVTSSYGAAGSLVVLLLWVYYSAQILFLGAEFTQVYANRFGTRVQPAENAEPVTETERAKQGMPRQGAAPQSPGVQATTRAGSTSQVALAQAGEEPARTGLIPLAQPFDEPVVGPYEPLPAVRGASLVEGEPSTNMAPMKGRDYLMAILTFAAGLGAGAIMANNSRVMARAMRQPPPPKRRLFGRR